MYIFHADPGHAWLAVKRKELIKLGVLGKISDFSYQNGATVYLEEDCDAGIFINAKKALGENIDVRESFKENTPIRRFEGFVA
jgi:hypothetical protein